LAAGAAPGAASLRLRKRATPGASFAVCMYDDLFLNKALVDLRRDKKSKLLGVHSDW
jgi:hypothetical protein